jgi:hypothetical protein
VESRDKGMKRREDKGIKKRENNDAGKVKHTVTVPRY